MVSTQLPYRFPCPSRLSSREGLRRKPDSLPFPPSPCLLGPTVRVVKDGIDDSQSGLLVFKYLSPISVPNHREGDLTLRSRDGKRSPCYRTTPFDRRVTPLLLVDESRYQWEFDSSFLGTSSVRPCFRFLESNSPV